MTNLYTVKAEVGVLSYKYSKVICKYWKFKTAPEALKSAKKIYSIANNYVKILISYKNDINNNVLSKRIIRYFIKLDICRKFLQMGFTRAMRYYYHKSGKKWSNNKIEPIDYDTEKKKSALIFKKYLNKLIHNDIYIRSKAYYQATPIEYRYVDI
jgi:hypothetical protein